ncbi:PH domain-containing protein [Bacillus sp. TL12]|uniref:PH domain-containing protein n=1 Tax=Bacillus sp. TL12 TaxID=2894756 RepID=UPI00321F81E3
MRKISKIKNPLAAPAPSFDRLEILHGTQFETELISPRDTKQFVSLIKSIHPQVEIANNLIQE